MQISRRDALLGATAAAVVAGAITAPLALKPVNVNAASVHAVDPMLAMGQDWLSNRVEIKERNDFWNLAYDRLPGWARSGVDQYGRNCGWPDVGDLPEFRSACKADLSTRPNLTDVHSFNENARIAAITDPAKYAETITQCDARVRGWVTRLTEQTNLQRQVGIYNWDAEVEPLYERQDAVEDNIKDTQAHSFAGIAVKLRLAAHYASDGLQDSEGLDGNWERQLILSALRDLDRLAGEARS